MPISSSQHQLNVKLFSETALVGMGRVGRALAWAMYESQWPLSSLYGRSAQTDLPLPVQKLNTCQNTTAKFWILCVPDDQIPSVTMELSGFQENWEGYIVAHTSGIHSAKSLELLRKQGASVMSFHPLQSFPPRATPDLFKDIFIVLEGDQAALDVGAALAIHLGAQPRTISSDAKPAYHMAASMVSNFTVVLMGIVHEVLSEIGFSEHDARHLLQPLLSGTLQNLSRYSAEVALTGPIVRGDTHTIAQHLKALSGEHLAQFALFYHVLAAETTRLALKSGRLSNEQAIPILDLIRSHLQQTDS